MPLARIIKAAACLAILAWGLLGHAPAAQATTTCHR